MSIGIIIYRIGRSRNVPLIWLLILGRVTAQVLSESFSTIRNTLVNTLVHLRKTNSLHSAGRHYVCFELLIKVPKHVMELPHVFVFATIRFNDFPLYRRESRSPAIDRMPIGHYRGTVLDFRVVFSICRTTKKPINTRTSRLTRTDRVVLPARHVWSAINYAWQLGKRGGLSSAVDWYGWIQPSRNDACSFNGKLRARGGGGVVKRRIKNNRENKFEIRYPRTRVTVRTQYARRTF